jgi:hypothetical protein
MTTGISTTHNSTYKKLAVQWLNEALCFYQRLCLVDSEVLNSSFVHLMKFSAEKPRLRKAAKRYVPFYQDTQNRQPATKLKEYLLIICAHIIFVPTISSSK